MTIIAYLLQASSQRQRIWENVEVLSQRTRAWVVPRGGGLTSPKLANEEVWKRIICRDWYLQEGKTGLSFPDVCVSHSVPSPAIPWTAAHEVSLSMGFSSQRYWNGLPFPSPGDLRHPGMKTGLLHCRQTLYRLSYHGSPHFLIVICLNGRLSVVSSGFWEGKKIEIGDKTAEWSEREGEEQDSTLTSDKTWEFPLPSGPAWATLLMPTSGGSNSINWV